MIYLVAGVNFRRKLPKVVAEAAKRTLQMGADLAVWFVDIDCTRAELVDMIRPDDEEYDEDNGPLNGMGMVVPMETYGGFAESAVWQWLKAKRK